MTPPVPPTRPAGSSFFQWIRRQGLTRSPDRWFGGVAAGLARRLGWDPVLVRGLFVVATIFSGAGPLLYGLAWLLLPEESDGRIHLEELALRGQLTAGFWGGTIFSFVGLVETPSWLAAAGLFGFAFMVAVLVSGLTLVAYAANRGRGTMPSAPPPSPTPPPGATPGAGPWPAPAAGQAPPGAGPYPSAGGQASAASHNPPGFSPPPAAATPPGAPTSASPQESPTRPFVSSDQETAMSTPNPAPPGDGASAPAASSALAVNEPVAAAPGRSDGGHKDVGASADT
ncbi:MAG: PspC domain-containing protein, partial [Bifidobacteriaceae bacterium]|nr:PspC domain-containing protein [Bifidobacteriaceae bacterium]